MLRFTRSVAIFAALCCTQCHAQSNTPTAIQPGKEAFFMLLSDPQMGMYEKDASSLQETANFDMAVATANRVQPAFLIICGDLVNKRGDAGEIDAFFATAKQLAPGIPLHLVAGNHDLGNVPTPQTLADYRARFGPDFYTFQQNGIFGVVLDSSLMGTKGNEEEDQQQLAWLDKKLQEAHEKGFGKDSTAIFQHIPFFLASVAEPDQYFNVPSVSRGKYLETMHRYGIEHVFAGHYHRNAQAVDGALQMLTTGPIGKPLGPDDSGIRLVHFGPKWQAPYFSLGRLPDSTTLREWESTWAPPATPVRSHSTEARQP